MPDQPHSDVLQHTADVVSAHLGYTKMVAEALPQLIQSVYLAFLGLSAGPEVSAVKREPAVPIRKSVYPEYIVCLEDSKKLKMLKLHLETSYNMTPEDYCEKWNLTRDYPMVAPSSLCGKLRLILERSFAVP